MVLCLQVGVMLGLAAPPAPSSSVQPKGAVVSFHSELTHQQLRNGAEGFPGGTVVENLPANAGDTGSSPGPGRSHMPRSN